MKTETKLSEVNKYGKLHQGRKEYIEILNGKPSTWKSRCLAMCYDCMGYYADGKADCENELCPLYRGMPYRNVVKTSSATYENDETTDEYDNIDTNSHVEKYTTAKSTKWGSKKND